MSTSASEVIDFSKLPKRLNAQDIMSSNSWIRSRRWKSIIPREQSNFGHQSASGVVSSTNLSRTLTFYISDPELYMDGASMYLHSDFRAVATRRNDADNADINLDAYLDVGGAQSCIEQIQVEMANRTLENINEYDKLYSAVSMVSDSPHYVNYNLMNQADSWEDYYQPIKRSVRAVRSNSGDRSFPITISVNDNDNSLYDLGGGPQVRALIIDGGNMATQDVRCGDIIKLTLGTRTVYVVVDDASIINEGNVSLTVNSSNQVFAGADENFTNANNNKISSIQVVGSVYNALGQEAVQSTRARVLNQADGAVRLAFELKLDSLKQMTYIPLRFLKAPMKITIRFKEAPLAIVLRNPAEANSNNKIGYVFSEPELVVPMIEAHDSAIKAHQQIVDNQGLVFPYKTYEHHQREFNNSASNVNLTFQTNLASVRHGLFVITDTTLANSNTTASQGHPSNSTFYKNFLKTVRYQIGAERFPDYGDLDVDEIFSSEALQQTFRAVNGDKMSMKDMDKPLRIEPWEYQDRDSEKFVLAIPFSKDDSTWTGVNLSLNYLELKMEFGGTPSNLSNNGLLHCWLCHDAIVRIHKDGVSVFS